MKEKGIMKKWLLTLCVALLSLGAQAQERGDFAVGVRGGIDIVRFDFGKWSDTSHPEAYHLPSRYAPHWS